MNSIMTVNRGPMDPDECGKKWLPLTEGVKESSKLLVAWCLEKESRALQDMDDAWRAANIGAVLKFVFPLTRCVVDRFSTLDRLATGDDAAELAELLQSQVNLQCDTLNEEVSGGVDIDALKAHNYISSMGDRLADYILSYPRLN